MKHTALVIENEYDVDNQVKAFIKDNQDLFESVDEQCFCLNRSVEGLKSFIIKSNALIIASTFMYKDQLIEYLDLFLSPNFPSQLKYSFFVNDIVMKLNGWIYERPYSEETEIVNKVKQLMKAGHTIYSYSDIGDQRVTDDLNIFYEEKERNTYVHNEVKYDEIENIFYTDHENSNLESELFLYKKKMG